MRKQAMVSFLCLAAILVCGSAEAGDYPVIFVHVTCPLHPLQG